jgi:hypothetical protein
MRIRTRMAGAIAGTAFAGLTALAVGTAAPAGAQQVKTGTQAVSVAPQGCGYWDDCGGWDDDYWGGGWNSWDSSWYYSSW